MLTKDMFRQVVEGLFIDPDYMEFVEGHGQEYSEHNTEDFRSKECYRYVGQRECYKNSLLKSLEFYGRLHYVEGWVLTSHDIIIQHAWCIDWQDKIVDFTANKYNHNHVKYVGVKIERHYLTEIIEVLENGMTPLEILINKLKS